MKTFLAFLAGASSVVLVTIVIGIVAQKNKEHEILHELDALESVEAVLLQAVVPDSIKQEAHDASHTIMYAEPDGNDYWSARSKMSIASEWAEENCSACRALQSMIEVRKERLTKLRE